MKVLWVFAHPEPRSLNGSLRDFSIRTLEAAGHEVRQSDLYALRWKAVADGADFTDTEPGARLTYAASSWRGFKDGTQTPDVAAEQAKIRWADAVLIQFPLWWFGLPAILKGWVDRVFVAGRVYGGGRVYGTGVFRGKQALLALTTGAPEETYRKEGFNGDIAGILRPVHRGILQFVGFDVLAPQIVYGPVRMMAAQRELHLAAYVARLQGIADESPIDVGSY